MTTVISVENLSKVYRLGQIGTGTISYDLQLWWAKIRGKPNPRLRIGETDHGNRDSQDLWALKGVSFTVKQGEVLGIIGKNGAGKSTLLKILSRVTAPTSGRVRVKGRIASLLEVGTGFHPELTGRENTYLNGAILGMSRQEIDRKFDEIVDFSGVEKFIDTPVKRYSSGMYVRLAFAVAAHLEPEILLVDEVLAVGDAEFQKKCLGKMGEVAKEGRTVLFVSHNMAAIQQLCSSGFMLDEGRITYSGKPYECIDHYLKSEYKRSGNIMSRVRCNDLAVKINTITVNGSQSDTQRLAPACKQLNVKITGQIDRPMKLLLEARIFDNREQCIAFYTPRKDREQFEEYQKGQFNIFELIKLPHLNQGIYVLDLYIADLNQNTTNPVHVEKAVRLDAEGTPIITGWVFKYDRGNGWMLLESGHEQITTRKNR